jgi:transcriptional regulator with XRE-family HTH domain
MAFNPPGERVRYIRTEIARMSQAGFAQLLNVSQSSLSDIEANRNMPGYLFCYLLHTAYRVNLNWLYTGEGTIQVES